MDPFPSNSHQPKPVVGERPERTPVLKVVDGNVVVRKKPLGTRLIQMFFGDGKNVVDNVVSDVLVPALKEMITEAVSTGMERMVFGERGHTRRPHNRPSAFGGGSYTNYTRYATPPKREERPTRPRSRSSRDFEDIIIPTRREAEVVLHELHKIMDKYELVSVRDLYELVGVEFHNTDEKFGWTDLETAGIRRVSNGYLLVMPEIESLD